MSSRTPIDSDHVRGPQRIFAAASGGAAGALLRAIPGLGLLPLAVAAALGVAIAQQSLP